MLWAQKLIEFQWEESQKLWKSRCDIVHKEEGHRASARELHEAKIKLKAMYSNKGKLLQADRDLLPGTAEEQLAKHPHQILRFVKHTEDIFKFCVADAQTATIIGNQDIRNYFTGTQSDDNNRAIRQAAAARHAKAQEPQTKTNKLSAPKTNQANVPTRNKTITSFFTKARKFLRRSKAVANIGE